jgi:hypothetical protein
LKIVRRTKMPLKSTMCIVSCLLLITLIAGPALSEEPGYSHHEEGYENSNDVALFLGGSHHKNENGFSVGLDYEHRLNSILGVGGLVEYSAGDFDSWVVAAPLFVHPYGGFRLIFAPGFETKESKSNFLFRTGLAYQFEIGHKWSISPEYNVDFVHHETVHVYGVSFGFGF